MATELPEGTVTVVFTDAVGSTALTNELGDERARELMREVEETVRAQVARHRGVEVKGLGDGQMIAFTSARRAVLCAVDIQKALDRWHRSDARRQPLGLRIGLHTGEVIREQEDLFGAAVNFAARVAAAAGTGEVLLSETTKSLLGTATDLELVDRGESELKGFAGRWRLFAVSWEPEADAAGEGRGLYVGRAAEQATLRDALARAKAGAGSVLFLSGEPGIGKTSLARETMAEARTQGFFTALGHCYEMDGTPPFVPFVEIFDHAFRVMPREPLRALLGDDAPEVARIVPRLRTLYPDLPPAIDLPPEQARHYLFSCIADYLVRSAGAQPLMLVFDDLHWADESTTLLLEHIAGRTAEAPLLIAGTYRDTDLDASRPFAAALGRMSRLAHTRRVALRRLDTEAVRALLAGLSGCEPPVPLVSLISAETDGVPLFIQELYRYLAEQGRLFRDDGAWRADVALGEVEVPEGVRLVIGRRLERLAEETRRILATAAAIGRAFSFDLLAALSDGREDAVLDAVDEALAAGLLAEASAREARYTFSHEQVRQTLLGTLTLPRRQRLHLRVADALERVHGTREEEHAAEIAHHLYQAGAAADPERTLRWLEVAGDSALKSLSAVEAQARYCDALGLSEQWPATVRARLLEKLGHAVRGMDWEAAERNWRQAQDLYQELGDAVGIGRTAFHLGTVLMWNRADDYSRSRREVDRGLAVVDKVPDDLACRLFGVADRLNIFDGAPERAEAWFTQALPIAMRSSDPQLLGELLEHHSWFGTVYHRPRAILDADPPAVELLRRSGDLWNFCNAALNRRFAFIATGQLAAARALAEEAVAAGERSGNALATATLHFQSQIVDFIERGDFVRFREAVERMGEAWPSFNWLSAPWQQLTDFRMGNWRSALSSVRNSHPLATSIYRGVEQGALVLVEACAGGEAEVAGLFQESRHLLPTGAIGNFGGWSFAAAATDALATTGFDDEAAALLPLWQDALQHGQLIDTWLFHLSARVAGIAAMCAGRWELAEQYFETAVRQAHDIPHVIEQPEVRRWYADMLIRRAAPGDMDRARQLLDEAMAMYTRIGMHRHIGLAEALLARMGA
jgi:class 3 adenylate cyclase/tetratricopeptide (TPR) repeat protein